MLKKKLARYIVEAKRERKERKGEWRENRLRVLKREEVRKESLERQIPWRLKKLRSFGEQGIETKVRP